MNISDLTVNLRVTLNGCAVPLWRARLLGWAARILGVPLKVTLEV